ncbi:MAG: hypothetical protein IKO36_10970 [Bacteroidaceae bacterium]|nr:hypothetical protein [Bacteroidaceae bacterium]
MKKYVIDNISLHKNRTTCNVIFDTSEDACQYMKNNYTKTEREGLVVIPVEVGFLVYVYGDERSKCKKYVWAPYDIEQSQCYNYPGDPADYFPTYKEAEVVKQKVKEYAVKHGYLLNIGIEECVLYTIKGKEKQNEN